MVERARRVRALPGADPVGNVTRGTTNPNRLRRVDRWLAGPQAWRLPARPARWWWTWATAPPPPPPSNSLSGSARSARTCRWPASRSSRTGPAAKALERPGLAFRLGGFELPVDGRPALVRAFNVLRQYEEADVPAIWAGICSRLAPAGIFIDGTCDEIGRRASWMALDGGGPLSLTLSMRSDGFDLPSDVAERLPKALIHRNVRGERVHIFLQALDRAWLESAPLASFGNRQRWLASCGRLRDCRLACPGRAPPLAAGRADRRLGRRRTLRNLPGPSRTYQEP